MSKSYQNNEEEKGVNHGIVKILYDYREEIPGVGVSMVQIVKQYYLFFCPLQIGEEPKQVSIV